MAKQKTEISAKSRSSRTRKKVSATALTESKPSKTTKKRTTARSNTAAKTSLKKDQVPSKATGDNKKRAIAKAATIRGPAKEKATRTTKPKPKPVEPAHFLEIREMISDLVLKNSINSNLHQEVSTIRGSVIELQDTIAHFRHDLINANAGKEAAEVSRAVAETEIQRLLAETGQKDIQISQLSENMKEISDRFEHLHQQFISSQNQVLGFEKSMSWRLTAPIRLVGSAGRLVLRGPQIVAGAVKRSAVSTVKKSPVLKRVTLATLSLTPGLDRRLRSSLGEPASAQTELPTFMLTPDTEALKAWKKLLKTS